MSDRGQRNPASRSSRGFTVVELLVVLAIIGLLVAILIPAVQAAREAARRSTCQNRLRQIAVAVQEYEGARRHLPASRFLGQYGQGPRSTAWSWLAMILPQLEEGNMYEEGGLPDKSLRLSFVADRQLSILLCPSDSYSNRGPRIGAGNLPDEGAPFPVGQSNFKGVCGANWGKDASLGLEDIRTDWPNAGTNGSWDGQNEGDGILRRSDANRPRRFRVVTDGTSKTFMIGEDSPEKNNWCSWPYANNAHGTCAIPPNVAARDGSNYTPAYWPNVNGFRSAHAGGLHFAHADASVHFVADDIDLGAYRARATIAGSD